MCGFASGMMNGPWAGGMFTMMIIGPLLFIIVLGLTVYFVARFLIRKNKVEDQPFMILRDRLAKGEITEEEYKVKEKLLNER